MSRPQWETVWAFVVERALLEWAQEWSGSSVQQPGPVSPLRENIDFANSGLSSWSESLSPWPKKTQPVRKYSWDDPDTDQTRFGYLVMWSMLWFGQYSWKVNKETSRGQKSCWCSCLEVSKSDGKKLSCYFSIISMQRGWSWSYWWWEETGVEQISEMGLGWFKITRNVRSGFWCWKSLMSD